MLEIEKKILNINAQEVEKALDQIGAIKDFDSIIQTYYFDYPDLRFKNQDQLLRIRTINNQIEVCYKFDRTNQENTRFYQEKEFNLDLNQLDNIIDFFKSIGFIQTYYFEKRRIQYKHENTKFELDFYPKLNPLVEIESDSIDSINNYINQLGLSTHEQTDETINELFSRLNPHLNLNGLKLEQ